MVLVWGEAGRALLQSGADTAAQNLSPAGHRCCLRFWSLFPLKSVVTTRFLFFLPLPV